MANKTDLKIGQTVWVHQTDARNPFDTNPNLSEVKITEIGNKYFRTTYGHRYKFEIDSLLLCSNYNCDREVIIDKEEFFKKLKNREKFFSIKKKINESIYFNDESKDFISPEKIEQIYNILFS